MQNLKIEFLQSELNRVSEWIKFSDTKTGFLTAYYSAIIGFVISEKDFVLKNIENYQKWMFALYLFTFIGVIISFTYGMHFLFRSIFPRLKNLSTDKSLFYFGHVANMKLVNYSKEFKELTEDRAKEQLIEQIHTNSTIADQKMKNVQKSIKSFAIFVIFVILLFLLGKTW